MEIEVDNDKGIVTIDGVQISADLIYQTFACGGQRKSIVLPESGLLKGVISERTGNIVTFSVVLFDRDNLNREILSFLGLG